MATSAAQDDKKKALNLAIAQIEKNCGKGSIMKMGSESMKVKVDAIPTGAINLDAAVGIGGIPRGRVTEIYGPESSGKTTLCLHVVANAQKMGGVAAYIDAEHALDVEYARKLGVDVESMLVSQPDTGEQALEICEILVRSGAVDVVVIDRAGTVLLSHRVDNDETALLDLADGDTVCWATDLNDGGAALLIALVAMSVVLPAAAQAPRPMKFAGNNSEGRGAPVLTAEEAAQTAGLAVLLGNSDGKPEREEAYFDQVVSGPHRVFVVFNDDAYAEFKQLFEGDDELDDELEREQPPDRVAQPIE